jgi:Ca2+-binding EF-hand superfamily protein
MNALRTYFFCFLFVTTTHAFLPSKRSTRIKERDHRDLSDLHLHSPIHTRWRDHEYEYECNSWWDEQSPKKSTINPEEFHEMIKSVAEMHRKRSALTIHAPKPIHVDAVFAAFDIDKDGKISAEDEHKNEEALYLANMWLAQAEMVEQHEEQFMARHKDSIKKRVHRKRYHAFNPHSTRDTLEQVTDVNRDGFWSEKELGDALNFIHFEHDSRGRSVLQHYHTMFRILDMDKSGDVSREEVVKTKYVDNLEQFIEQESLRHIIHELEDRFGYSIDPHRYDYLDKEL